MRPQKFLYRILQFTLILKQTIASDIYIIVLDKIAEKYLSDDKVKRKQTIPFTVIKMK